MFGQFVMKGELQENIIKAIAKQYRKMGFLADSNEKKELPLFLSGGVDSTLCALVAHSLGLKPVCISFQRKGISSKDFIQAERTCLEMGWKFHPVVLPEEPPKDAFFRMIKDYRVDKKTELEVLYPFTFLFDEVRKLGFSKVVFGQITTADSRKRNVELRNSAEDFWHRVITTNTPSPATKKIVQVFKDKGITVCCPMEGKSFKKLFTGLSYDEINKPVAKAVYKKCFPNEFENLGMTKVRNIPLQKGGSINDFFESLVDDDEINPIINGKRKYKSFSAALVKYHSNLYATEDSVGSRAHRRWVENAVSNPAMNYHQARMEVQKELFPLSYKMEDVFEASNKKLFTVVSTFAGGGGSSTGYRLAGGKVLGANEFIPEAIETYKRNYPETFVDGNDIRKITGSKKDGVLNWFETFGVKKGELDILDGSPPCATFSKASGKRTEDKDNHEAKGKKYSEVEQDRIGMLIHDYVYLANVILPKICIIENVPEIGSSTVFHDALRRLRGSGYFVQFQRLKAHHFGVPQRRERMFAVGVRKDIAKEVGIKTEIEVKKLFPMGSSFHPSVMDALSTLELNEQDRREIALIKENIRKSATYEIIRAIPKNPARPSRLHEHYKGFKNYYFNVYRCAWGEPAPTITQMGNQLGGRGGICHPVEDRTFTIRELKRLSSLPDDFKLTGTFNQKAERIGRMVPPLMTTALAKSLYENVLSKCSDMSLEH